MPEKQEISNWIKRQESAPAEDDENAEVFKE